MLVAALNPCLPWRNFEIGAEIQTIWCYEIYESLLMVIVVPFCTPFSMVKCPSAGYSQLYNPRGFDPADLVQASSHVFLPSCVASMVLMA